MFIDGEPEYICANLLMAIHISYNCYLLCDARSSVRFYVNIDNNIQLSCNFFTESIFGFIDVKVNVYGPSITPQISLIGIVVMREIPR